MEGAREAGRSLGGAGLVAIRSCGHWWSYVVPLRTQQMYNFARLNYRVPCPFCFADWQAQANAQARSPSRRVN